MARSRQRSTGSRGGRGGQDLARAARSSSKAASRRTAGVDDVEIVEEEGGAGLETGLALMTFIMIFAAWLLLDAELGKHYGEGLFFK